MNDYEYGEEIILPEDDKKVYVMVEAGLMYIGRADLMSAVVTNFTRWVADNTPTTAKPRDVTVYTLPCKNSQNITLMICGLN